MAKYRKKPVVIDAFKCGFDWMPEWFEEEIEKSNIKILVSNNKFAEIKTLEGTMIADKGDYIIQGISGEIYPCKPGIFEKTYEMVED
jgi:hypothetical protein